MLLYQWFVDTSSLHNILLWEARVEYLYKIY